MKVSGLQKLTLLDFPGRVACTAFTAGCNFRCPFCHNASLVLGGEGEEDYAEEDILAFLNKRKGLLDGLALTGGEPLLHPGAADFLARVKDLGYAVKLDTNGSFPDRLRDVVERGLADYVAMDVKNSPAKYALTAGVDLDLGAVRESVSYLLSGQVPCEFRTTVVKELHEADDFVAIGEWIAGAPAYFLQRFVDSDDLIVPGYSACSKAEMEAFADLVRPFVSSVALRGVD